MLLGLFEGFNAASTAHSMSETHDMKTWKNTAPACTGHERMTCVQSVLTLPAITDYYQ